MSCEFCKNLNEMETEYPDDPHHGGIKYCDECEAEYYVDFWGNLVDANAQGRLNHPKILNF